MFTFKPEVIQAWNQVGLAFKEAAAQLSAAFMAHFKPNARTASVNPNIYKPLRLNLQFFAEGDPPPPPSPDGFFPTLKDAFKANPHLQAEHKTAITNAVADRFKNYNFDIDEAKTAIAEKQQRERDKAEGKDTESQELRTLKEKTTKLEAKTKKLALDALTGDPEQSKLISRLAADKVAALTLNDNFELEADAVKGIVSELREEFPNLFPVAEGSAGENDPPPPPPPAGTRGSGGAPPLNQPPNPKDQDVAAIVAASYEALKKTHQI